MLDSERPDNLRPPSGTADALPVFGSSFKVYGDRWPEIRSQALALGVLKDTPEEDQRPLAPDKRQPALPPRAEEDRPEPARPVLTIPESKRSPIAAVGVETGG